MVEGITISELEVSNILKPNKFLFTREQIDSLCDLMGQVADFDGEANKNQRELIDVVKREFDRK